MKDRIEQFLRGPAASSFLRRFGIDPRRYWLLIDLFHKLSTRNEVQGHLGQQHHALRISAVWFLLFSGVAAVVAIAVQARVWIPALIMLAFTAFVLLGVLLSEAANSLVNPEEALSLSHQPINGATYTAAKLSHLFNIVLYTVMGWNLLPALASPFMKGGRWFFPPLQLLAAMSLGILMALLCCSVYGLVMRVVPARRMKSAAQFIQAIPIAIFSVLQFAPRGTRRAFANAVVAAAAPLRNIPAWLLVLMAAGIAGAITVIGLRSLSADYLIRASSLVHGHSAKITRARRSLLGETVQRFFGGQIGRAGFEYAKLMLLRDWQFRRRLLGLMPMMIGGTFGMFSAGLSSPFDSGFSAAHILPHIIGLLVFMICALLPYGTDHKGIWLFLLVSDRAYPRFARGFHASLWLTFIVAPNALLFPLFVWRWGPSVALAFLLYSVASSSVYLAFGLRNIDGVPFGKQTQPGRDTAGQGGAYIFGIMIGALLAAGLQYLVFRSAVAVAIAIPVIAAMAYFLTRWALRTFEVAIRHHLGTTSQTSTMIYKEV